MVSIYDLTQQPIHTSICHTLLLSQDGQQLLQQLALAVNEGLHSNSLLNQPHLVLVNQEFYQSTMLPLLARMLLLWLRCVGIPLPDSNDVHYHEYVHIMPSYLQDGADDSGTDNNTGQDGIAKPRKVLLPCPHHSTLECYLISPVITSDSAPGNLIEGKIQPHAMELLNLARQWLHTYLPHVISKIIRVHFGLLSSQYLKKTSQSNCPKSRKLSAVPFVGKDTPSPSSEFAHVDILAGLTLIAYTQQGLRLSDTISLLIRLKDSLSNELGPESTRPSSILFSTWLRDSIHHQSISTSSTRSTTAVTATSTTPQNSSAATQHDTPMISLGALQIGDKLQI